MREIQSINNGWAFHKGDTRHHKIPKSKKDGKVLIFLTHGTQWTGRTEALIISRSCCWYFKELEILPKTMKKFILKSLPPHFRQRFTSTELMFAHIRAGFQSFEFI